MWRELMEILYGLLFLFTAITVQTTWAGSSDISAHLNLDKAGLAIQGYDPVSYHTEGPAKGKKEYSLVHHGTTYLFSNPGNLKKFLNNPVAYLPACGGWCAWAMLDGEKIEVDPETYKIIDGVTYLFYNSFFTNTLSKWNTRAERETENTLIKKAWLEWAALIQKG
jgi:YHS domain-containing protein